MVKNKVISESIDNFGLPRVLAEAEIEIEFQHEGRPGIAVYDIEGGLPARNDPDPSVEYPDVELQGYWFTDKDPYEPIYPKYVFNADELEDKAVQHWVDNFEQYLPGD